MAPSNLKSIKEKQEIIKDHKLNKFQRQLAQKYKITKSQVQRILASEEGLSLCDVQFQNKNKFRLSCARFKEVEKRTYEWFSQARAHNIPVSGPILQAQAFKVSSAMDQNTAFVASVGWLNRFIERYIIKFKCISGEGAAVDENLVKKFKDSITNLCDGYHPRYVYNLDETGLFHHLLSTLPSDMTVQNSKITILDAVTWINSSWKNVKEETITKCFKKCGSPVVSDPVHSDAVPSGLVEIEPFNDLPSILSHNEWQSYITFDNALTVTEQNFDEWENNFFRDAKKFY